MRDDPDRAVLHDLRLSVDGEIAQIDHVVMTRGMHVYLLETKNFGGSVHINAHGEFSVEYSRERIFGIESPIEQSRRHEGVLSKVLALLEIGGRVGGTPRMHHCVLVHPKATIHRPDAKSIDTSMVIKADQFRSWHEKFTEQISVTELFGTMLSLRSADTLRLYAEKLARQHRPANLLELPPFMKPVEAVAPPAISKAQEGGAPAVARSAVAQPASRSSETAARKRLQCATCDVKISYAEGKFCWNNERRFGGLQYCREHQTAF